MTWERLASVTLGSSADVLDSGTFTAKKHLRVSIFTIATGGATNHAIRYNADTGSNYQYRRNANGTSEGNEQSQSSDPSISGSISSSAGNVFADGIILNKSDSEKVARWDTTFSNTAGAGNIPMRREGCCKWVRTSGSGTGDSASQITRIYTTNDSAGSYDTGSTITVWGADDQASTPFYPYLSNGTIFEESDTGKHYMWDGTSAWNEM